MLSLDLKISEIIIKHALSERPNEACGLFAADLGTTDVHTFFPMRNTAESNFIYQLDAKEMIEVEAKADELGIQIIGVMHSHTHTEAYPSPTDVRDAAHFDPFGSWHYIIVSLENDDPVIRSFRIVDETIIEEEITIN